MGSGSGATGASALAVADLLVDTDVFIDHLRGSRRLRPEGQRISYSIVTRCELFAGRDASESGIRELLAPFQEIAIDRAIAERAGRLRRVSGLGTPDALIAAAALERGLELVTRNRKDFESVPGLRWRDPASLTRS